MLGVAPEDFSTAAECILVHRTRAVHPSDVEQLDEAVEEMADLINPALERMAKWECLVVKSYVAIKAAFMASSRA